LSVFICLFIYFFLYINVIVESTESSNKKKKKKKKKTQKDDCSGGLDYDMDPSHFASPGRSMFQTTNCSKLKNCKKKSKSLLQKLVDEKLGSVDDV
jgi:hypothetical protein